MVFLRTTVLKNGFIFFIIFVIPVEPVKIVLKSKTFKKYPKKYEKETKMGLNHTPEMA